MPAFQFAPPRRRCRCRRSRIVYEMFLLLLSLSRPAEKVCDVVLAATRSRSVGRREEGEEAANGKQDRFSVRSLMSGTDGMG